MTAVRGKERQSLFRGPEGLSVASFTVPELDRYAHRVPTDRLKEVEALLAETFGGFSVRRARRLWPDRGVAVEEPVRRYEVAFLGSPEKQVIPCARRIASLTDNEAILVMFGDKVLVAEANRTITVARPLPEAIAIEPAEVYKWPRTFDIAILAVIGQELEAVQKSFGVDRFKDACSLEGSIYFRASARRGELSIVIHCQGTAGNDAAAVAAERLIATWQPEFIFLVGIAAGRKGKIRIGDVVTPRVVVDDTLGVARARRRYKRPVIGSPPYPMIQCLQSYRHDERRWHRRLLELTKPPKPPTGRERWYGEHVALEPRAAEAAIYSSNVLLRDPQVLEEHAQATHQQIQVGEMEAAGFSYACQARRRPVPWFVVRAVSDFGDSTKSDQFFTWAAHSAATYLLDVIEDAIKPERRVAREDSPRS